MTQISAFKSSSCSTFPFQSSQCWRHPPSTRSLLVAFPLRQVSPEKFCNLSSTPRARMPLVFILRSGHHTFRWEPSAGGVRSRGWFSTALMQSGRVIYRFKHENWQDLQCERFKNSIRKLRENDIFWRTEGHGFDSIISYVNVDQKTCLLIISKRKSQKFILSLDP